MSSPVVGRQVQPLHEVDPAGGGPIPLTARAKAAPRPASSRDGQHETVTVVGAVRRQRHGESSSYWWTRSSSVSCWGGIQDRYRGVRGGPPAVGALGSARTSSACWCRCQLVRRADPRSPASPRPSALGCRKAICGTWHATRHADGRQSDPVHRFMHGRSSPCTRRPAARSGPGHRDVHAVLGGTAPVQRDGRGEDTRKPLLSIRSAPGHRNHDRGPVGPGVLDDTE